MQAIIYCFLLLNFTQVERKPIVNNIQNSDNNLTEKEVLEVIEKFNQAFANNNPDTYFTFIDDEITIITPSNPYRVEGIKDDREEFEYSLKTGRGRVGYFQEMQPKVQLFGNVVIVTYFSRGSYGPENKVFYLKETDVLVKKAGKWKIVHIHVSATK